MNPFTSQLIDWNNPPEVGVHFSGVYLDTGTPQHPELPGKVWVCRNGNVGIGGNRKGVEIHSTIEYSPSSPEVTTHSPQGNACTSSQCSEHPSAQWYTSVELDESLQTVFREPMQPLGTNGVMVMDEILPEHMLLMYVFCIE